MTDFSLPIKYAFECEPCPLCEEPWCAECELHYFECNHPGPDSDPDEEE